MTPPETTTIEITTENWQWLSGLKEPGESFNDVLDRLRRDDQERMYENMVTETGRKETLPAGLPDDVDLPGSGKILDARRATLAQLWMYLQEERSATKADFLELVDPDYVGYSSAESFWANAIKGRDTLQVLPNVEAPNEGQHAWRYVE